MKKLVVCAAVLLLSGCSWFGKGVAPAAFACPEIGLVNEADVIALGAGPVLTPETVAAEATFGNYRGACKPNARKSTVDFDIEVDFTGKKGPAGAALAKAELPYFIALLSPEEQILQREAFTAEIAFDETGTAPMTTEQHHVALPVKDLAQAGSYKVVIGFALTPEQMAWNKAEKLPPPVTNFKGAQ